MHAVNTGRKSREQQPASLEEFVQKGDVSGGKVAFGDAPVLFALQRGNAQGAVELVGVGVLGEQVLEVVAAADARSDRARQQALSGSGWPEQEHVMACKDGKQAEPGFALALREGCVEAGEEERELLAGGRVGGVAE